MTQPSKSTLARRDVLRVLATAAGAAASTTAASVPAPADSEPPDEKRAARYRASEHVQTFYRVNRYPR